MVTNGPCKLAAISWRFVTLKLKKSPVNRLKIRACSKLWQFCGDKSPRNHHEIAFTRAIWNRHKNRRKNRRLNRRKNRLCKWAFTIMITIKKKNEVKSSPRPFNFLIPDSSQLLNHFLNTSHLRQAE